MKEIIIDPIWIFGALFSALGVGIGWYIVRLDGMVESLRAEIIKIEKDIGKLQNADVTCTRDQDILKMDMSHIRATMLKMVARRFMRKSLREEWKQAKKANKKLKATVLAQQGDIE
jgi:hypothetical protein